MPGPHTVGEASRALDHVDLQHGLVRALTSAVSPRARTSGSVAELTVGVQAWHTPHSVGKRKYGTCIYLSFITHVQVHMYEYILYMYVYHSICTHPAKIS